jgi:hypothetical protein
MHGAKFSIAKKAISNAKYGSGMLAAQHGM